MERATVPRRRAFAFDNAATPGRLGSSVELRDLKVSEETIVDPLARLTRSRPSKAPSEELVAMPLTLYAHPFSSYCQKVLIAFYENATPFTYREFGPNDPEAAAEWAALWPLKKMPVLVDGGRTVLESSTIIEHLDRHHPGRAPLIPRDPDAALDVRMMDRVFDNYIMTPMQKIVLDHLRPSENRDAYGVKQARELLGTAYAWLDAKLAGKQWATGESFTMVECAAAPSLFYADWVNEIPAGCANLKAYRARLLAHPAVSRAVDEARPYRKNFPPGAPDRD
jgi:glutathione S-transferase